MPSPPSQPSPARARRSAPARRQPTPPAAATTATATTATATGPTACTRLTAPTRRPALVALLAILTALVTVLPAVSAAADGTPDDVPRRLAAPPVIFVGAGSLTWADLDPARTPTLWRLAGSAAAGSVVVRTQEPVTCPADAWLTISAGARAGATRAPDGTCAALPPVTAEHDGGGTVQGWSRYVAASRGTYGAVPGLLGDQLDAMDTCGTAVGPGAALALADGSGEVDVYRPTVARLDRRALAMCPITLVDPGPLAPGGPARAADLASLDAAVSRLLQLAPRGSAVVVAGIADAAVGAAPARVHLHAAIATGRTPDGGDPWPHVRLASDSTRWPGLVQLTDVTPTLLAYAGLARPDALVGTPWRPDGPLPANAAATVSTLAADDVAPQTVTQVWYAWYWSDVLVLLLLLALSVAALAGSRVGMSERGARLAGWVAGCVGIALAALPAAGFLAQLTRWWRAGAPAVTLIGAATAIAVLLGVAALAAGQLLSGAQLQPGARLQPEDASAGAHVRGNGPTGRPLGGWERTGAATVRTAAGLLAGATALLVGVDVLTGSALQRSSVYGLVPLDGGRFYGIGNIAFGVLAGSALVAATTLAGALLARGRSRTVAALAVGAVGLAVIVVDGAPFAGADVGGVLAAVPGFAVLALSVAGIRPSWGRVVGIVAAAVGAVAILAVLDWLRPPAQRTHLGRFVATILDGHGFGLVQRKALASLDSLTTSVFAWLVPALLVAIAVLVARWDGRLPGEPDDAPWPLRPLLLAVLTTGIVGLLVNDSGVVVPASLMATVAAYVLAVLASSRLRAPAPAPVQPDDATAPAPHR